MGMVWPITYLRTKEMVKFGPKPAFLHPYHLLGRETAHTQPPTLTLDPKLINFYAEELHLRVETIGWPQMCSSGKGHQFPLFGWGLPGLVTSCNSGRACSICCSMQATLKYSALQVHPVFIKLMDAVLSFLTINSIMVKGTKWRNPVGEKEWNPAEFPRSIPEGADWAKKKGVSTMWIEHGRHDWQAPKFT